MAALLFFASTSYAQTPTARVQAIRFWCFGDVTRVAIQTQGDYKLVFDQIEKPSRLYLDLIGLRPPLAARRGMETIQVGDHRVKQIRLSEVSPRKTRIVFDLQGPAEVISSQLVNPDRLMVEVRPKGTGLPALSASHRTPSVPYVNPSPVEGTPVPVSVNPRVAVSAAPDLARATYLRSPVAPIPVSPSRTAGAVSAAKRDAGGDRSLVRVFGLKMGKVVIDPGHGGHDTGTIGPDGLMEKDLVLDVALRLGKMISQQLGAGVVYTRSDDTFVALEDRTRIANQEKADLFISIHANSSPEPSATGVETYYFNFTSDQSGLDLATRENAASASSISDLSDLLHKAVLQTKLEESREFAQKVQASLWASSVRMNSRSRDRGVRQAPFVVLIGATMPSVLAEVGFVSNPHDEKLMNRGDQRQRIAEALFKGVSQYANSLSHLQIARARTQ